MSQIVKIEDWTAVVPEHVFWGVYLTPAGDAVLIQFQDQNVAIVRVDHGKLRFVVENRIVLVVDEDARTIEIQQHADC